MIVSSPNPRSASQPLASPASSSSIDHHRGFVLGTIKDPQGSSIEELSFVGFFLLIDCVCVCVCACARVCGFFGFLTGVFLAAPVAAGSVNSDLPLLLLLLILVDMLLLNFEANSKIEYHDLFLSFELFLSSSLFYA
jgi:hypothetical protein